MIRLIGSTLALLLALAQTARAQDDRWQVTLDDERYVWDIRLVRLDGDSLVVRQSDSLVTRARGAHQRDPADPEVRGPRRCRRAGGGAGAMSALVGGDDEVYDLTPLEFADRLRTIQKILLLHPTEP